MNLARFPRRHYTEGQTPLEKLSNLTEKLEGPNIYVKRDDLLGGADMMQEMQPVSEEMVRKGRKAYVIPGHSTLSASWDMYSALRKSLFSHSKKG
jgi:D-cysteine desulfhydrase